MRYTSKFGTIENLRQVIAASRSMAEVARRCGYKDAGGTVAHLRKIAKMNDIDLSHFSGQGWSKGKLSLDESGLRRPVRD
jgi:hypothetical protein